MSDDEEIIYKGKSLGLYNYLKDLGYGDFETFELVDVPAKDRFQVHSGNPLENYKAGESCAVSRPNTSTITDHDYRKIVTILGSQLLFKEDVHLIESLLSDKHVCSQKPNYVFHTSVVVTGLFSSVIMFRSKANLGLFQYLVPAGFTVLFSCYSAWQFYTEFNENRKDYVFMTHINELKKLCCNVLKLSRFIKETEILSTGQAPINNIGSTLGLYSSSSIYKHTSIDDLPQWKTLPHLRKFLSDTVEEVLNVLTISVESLILCLGLTDRELVENHLRSINMDHLMHHPCSEKVCGPVTLTELKDLTSKYLSVQSEYLKQLAIIFSSVFLRYSRPTIQARHSEHFVRDKVFEIFTNLHKKLTDISFKLKMQYNIHNINLAYTSKNVSYKSSSSSQTREINELQNSVHNVFLLLYSALLRVRSIEDTLENIGEIGENQTKTKLSSDLTEKLTVLKEDLISTVRCYDVLCQQAISKNKIDTTKQNLENGSNVIEVNIKETGIVVGTSDFAVNSPDEVFLSLSGIINNEETSISECVEDWALERKPQFPKTLLSELSQTLKSRKNDFIEREKHALKRKGLQDIPNLSPSDEDSVEDEDSFSRKNNKGSIIYKRQDYSNSSDSDDEMDPFEDGAFLTKLKIDKKYQSDPYSDSDSSVQESQTIDKREASCYTSLSTASLANLTAKKSQMWNKNEEEFYSDGSES